MNTRNERPAASFGKVSESEQLRSAESQEGLASLAGGWEGSEELIHRVVEFPRTPPRPNEDLS